MGIQIPGISKQQFDNLSTEAVVYGTRFPFVTGRWMNYTAEATEVSVLTKDDGNDKLVVTLRNGEYETRCYVQLDPTRLGPNVADQEAAIQRNTDRLTLIVKSLDLGVWRNGLEVDVKRFRPGKIVAFSIIGDGTFDAKNNERFTVLFKGLAREMQPVKSLETAPAVAGGEIPF